MTIMAPSDENECRQMLYTGFMMDSPVAVRYPRGTGPGAEVEQQMTAIPLGKASLKRKGAKVALLSFGTTLQIALNVGERLDATVVNMRYVKPLDTDTILEMAGSHDILVTIEENMVAGGAGSAVNEVLALHGRHLKILNYGLPDRLIQHGSRDDMLLDAGLTEEGFEEFVKSRL